VLLGVVMPEQEYSDKNQNTDDDPVSGGEREDLSLETNSNDTSSELANELDDILDEIDSVLESNAEEFVKSYVQKGGQ